MHLKIISALSILFLIIILVCFYLLVWPSSQKFLCSIRRGDWRPVGFSYSCQLPSKDFNKDCTKGDQCQYRKCIGSFTTPPDASNLEILTPRSNTVGKCAKYRNNIGGDSRCSSIIENGKDIEIWCGDIKYY